MRELSYESELEAAVPELMEIQSFTGIRLHEACYLVLITLILKLLVAPYNTCY